MTDNNEVEAPVSDLTKQVLENLKAEGAELKTDNASQFNENGDLKTEDTEITAEEVKEEKPKEEKKEDVKIERDVSYVPTWKLKVAEDQKLKAEQKLAEAQSEIERLSQKKTLTHSEQQILDSSLQEIADEYNLDISFLEKFKNALTPKEAIKKLESLEEERNKLFQETTYNSEFEKDIVPLIKSENPDISSTALSQLKEDLKSFAFSEEYKKLPLSKIFRAEKESFNIPQVKTHKKTAESLRSGITRTNDAIDFDNISEQDFLSLSPEDKIKFARQKAGRK